MTWNLFAMPRPDLRPLAAALCLVFVGCGERTGPVAAPETSRSAQQPAGETGPALWRVSDADTTVHLFGTVHVLPAGVDWRTPAIDRAFEEARVVYFETDVEPDPAAMTALVARLGLYPPGQKLTERLSAEQSETLANACERLNVPCYQLEAMRPWLAATVISERVITAAGYDPASGVERSLAPAAAAQGKDVRKLETVEEQLRIFADMPEGEQISYLMDGLAEIEKETGLLDDLVKAWARGDVETIDKLMIEDELSRSPAIYRALIVDRNRRWTDTLTELMRAETGSIFVAVGAGHLAGEDGVDRLLAAKGLNVERIQ
jgi:uncharacterized protein